MTLTPRAKRVIDLAYDEARNLNNNYIGTEHLLLGLIREGEGVAARVLGGVGVELERVRREVVALHTGVEPPATDNATRDPFLRYGWHGFAHALFLIDRDGSRPGTVALACFRDSQALAMAMVKLQVNPLSVASRWEALVVESVLRQEPADACLGATFDTAVQLFQESGHTSFDPGFVALAALLGDPDLYQRTGLHEVPVESLKAQYFDALKTAQE